MSNGIFLTYYDLMLILVPSILCTLMHNANKTQKKILQGILILFLGVVLIYNLYFRN